VSKLLKKSQQTHNLPARYDPLCPQCKSVTDAICHYMLVIHPLKRVVAWKLYKDRQKCMEYNLYLYVKNGHRMTSSEFSTTLLKLMKDYIRVGLSIQPLRYGMITFQRAFVEPIIVEKGNNVGDLISSHTSKTANSIYHWIQSTLFVISY